jgi:hypothetical protein
MGSVLDQQFLFIIGSPRSGTSWLQLMLGSHPDVCTTVELRIFSDYTSPLIRAWSEESGNITSGRWHQGLPVLWSEEEFHLFLRAFLEKVYARVWAAKPQATHILDKYPSYARYVTEINQLCPNARFIHVLRDGRDVAVSMLAARKQIGFGQSSIAAAAREWKESVLKAREAARLTNRYLEVRYEEMLADTASSLRRVFDFCGLLAGAELIAQIEEQCRFETAKASRATPVPGIKEPEGHYRRGKVGSWRDEMSPLSGYVFDRAAGDLLRELGYAQRKWWARSPLQSFMVPLSARFLAALRRLRHVYAALRQPED